MNDAADAATAAAACSYSIRPHRSFVCCGKNDNYNVRIVVLCRPASDNNNTNTLIINTSQLCQKYELDLLRDLLQLL